MNKDDIISEKVKSSLENQMGASSMDINVITHNGDVDLSGFVDVLSEKQKAEKITHEIKGVSTVKNGITLCTDGNLPDKEIEQSVNKKLRNSLYQESLHGVTAKISKGTAIMQGTTETQSDRKNALKEASKSFGVKNVVNNIHVTSTNDDVSIQNELYRLFTLSYIDLQDLSTNVTDGIVTLEGFITNKSEGQNLVSIVEEIPGVYKVVNHLKNRPWSLE